MEINESIVKLVTKLVMEELGKGSSIASDTPSKNGLSITELSEAREGTQNDEVVVGLAPAFGTRQIETINGLSHYEVLREISAGVEEEGMRIRFVKFYSTSDVSFIALAAAKLSGSGIGLGLQSKGTAVIHQKDLYPLTNLELFPQAPLITKEMYRLIGKNTARYAKGQTPSPIEVQNDYMVRPKYQAKAALLHIKETELVDVNRKPVELSVTFERQVASNG